MMATPRSPRDFWSGLIFIAFGLGFAWLARNYPMGTMRRMGPGMFPFALGLILAGLGAIVFVRSLLVGGAPVGRLNLKGLTLVTTAALLFGMLIDGAGLIAAVVVAVIVSAAASIYFRASTALVTAAALAAFSVVVFIYGVGLPMKLIGRWFGA
jgi:hypothetical protein